ncbi:MAG: radical SAM protein [Desulfobacterales bacterium]|nr:radical SAM protein [Desulfobacterales bacterium]
MKSTVLRDAISNELLGLISNLSNKNLLRAMGVFEKLSSIDWHRQGVSAVRALIETDHPGINAVRRILKQANPKARSALLNNFILGSILLGYRRRLAFYNEHQVAPPGTLMISPTLRCNLKCYGCYADHHEHKHELTYEEVDAVVTDAAAAGTNFFLFLGGEPFIVPWLLDIVEKHSHNAFLIFTNGQLIDDQKVARLAQLGNAGIAIGVDGLQKETDERKGPGAFEKAMERMRALNKAGVLVGFSAMTSQKNFDVLHSEAFYDTMIENGAGYGWIPIAVPQGSACQDPNLVPTQAEKARIPELIRKIKQKKELLLVDFLTDAYLTEGCGAGRVMWHINANGDVEPCVLMPYAVDNIREKSFTEICKSDFLRHIRDISHRNCKNTQTCLMAYKPKEVLEVVSKFDARETSIGITKVLNELARA